MYAAAQDLRGFRSIAELQRWRLVLRTEDRHQDTIGQWQQRGQPLLVVLHDLGECADCELVRFPTRGVCSVGHVEEHSDPAGPQQSRRLLGEGHVVSWPTRREEEVVVAVGESAQYVMWIRGDEAGAGVPDLSSGEGLFGHSQSLRVRLHRCQHTFGRHPLEQREAGRTAV